MDKFYWADSGAEIDPKRVTIAYDENGTIVGYVLTEPLTSYKALSAYPPTAIRHVHRCPGCGMPIEHGYASCMDCNRLVNEGALG